ncbi:ATP-binding protein [Chitinophaga ginsengisoli]|uniref:Histidine kinase/DNA gyrase B/HSP90-like ATPase n=1 Tax=Chitinophaga ginsengisoli TaxID=363837 RepID=A0A2P8GLS4_9BACT|nr:ATP-binding protein [Chitinophaga ginsengisoli]PSL34885.1 histidine kinase/DNA gyrase B/HSP90-like ATPase [Chitinophaga ginsengisoli]
MQRDSVVLSPPPVVFIKSISEQGYTLSTAMSDLVDNSIAAGATRVEILMETNKPALIMYVADNGNGMSPRDLTLNMRFPSADMEDVRSSRDMGRFGLGLKTASFSQSRKFTVISRTAGSYYEGRCWDVEYLKKTGDWTLVIEPADIVEKHITDFSAASMNFHSADPGFSPNTLIVWEELYKLRKFTKNTELNAELEELRNHLGLVFHRFIQNGELEIRLNNLLIEPFDPFPVNNPGIQTIAEAFWKTGDNYIKFQGIILPKISEKESAENGSAWAMPNRTLEELQGIYVYRNRRLINYGGWLRTVSKASNLQFGRIRIDISNLNDGDFQLNVAKSSIKIPFSLKRAMADMISSVTTQAVKEYRDRIASAVIRQNALSKGVTLISKQIGAEGPMLKIDPDFEILRQLKVQLSPVNAGKLDILMHLIERKLNQIWQGETGSMEFEQTIDEAEKQRIIKIRKYYEEAGYSWEEIRQLLIESFGRQQETISFIESLKK